MAPAQGICGVRSRVPLHPGVQEDCPGERRPRGVRLPTARTPQFPIAGRSPSPRPCPPLLSVLISGPLVAEAAKHGLAGIAVAQFLLIVLVLGTGTDWVLPGLPSPEGCPVVAGTFVAFGSWREQGGRWPGVPGRRPPHDPAGTALKGVRPGPVLAGKPPGFGNAIVISRTTRLSLWRYGCERHH